MRISDWSSDVCSSDLEETPAAPNTTDNATEVFPPMNSRQYEAGLKLQPKSDLLIQLAYFKIDRGAAYAANLPGTDTLHFYTNGREVYAGGEMSITDYVTPDLAHYATETILRTEERRVGKAGVRTCQSRRS